MENRDFSREFVFQTSRSSGAGGQNVNKVSTKVELRFHVDNSVLLTEEEKVLIKEKLANHINQEGWLQVVSQTARTQLANKEDVVKKFYKLLQKAFFKPKSRKKTKPTQAMVAERLLSKKKTSEKKANRQKPILD
jgi:ribosome-associated protein